jgi:hypothetical protein
MVRVDRHVIAREGNVLRVDFRRDPDPPAPRFPGAGALRSEHPANECWFVQARPATASSCGARS